MSAKAIATQFYCPTPTELEELYERGYNFWNEGAYEHATECFAEVAMSNPLDRRYLFAFACAMEQQGETAHAVKLFMNALSLKPDDPFAYFHIACCFKTLGHLNEAREALNATVVLCEYQDNDEFNYEHLHQRAIALINELSH